MNLLFGQLGTKIFGGLSIALLLALGLVWMGKASAERQARKFQAQLATASALIEVQNAAVLDLKTRSDAAAKAARDALQREQARSAVSEGVARRIEAPRPLSGRCETPADVRSADL